MDIADKALFEQAMAEKTGKPAGYRPYDDGEEAKERWRCASAEVNEQFPHRDPDLTAWTDINRELYAVTNAILGQSPRSLADLAVQGQAYALAESQLWIEESYLEEGANIRTRMLIENMCRMLGVEPLPGAKVVPLAAGETRAAWQPPVDDPILAVIAEHDASYQPTVQNEELQRELEECGVSGETHINVHLEPHEIVAGDDPRWKAAAAEFISVWRRHHAAAWALVDTVPTTYAGLLSLLIYLRRHQDREAPRYGRCHQHYAWPSMRAFAQSDDDSDRDQWATRLIDSLAKSAALLGGAGPDAPVAARDPILVALDNWRAALGDLETAGRIHDEDPLWDAEANAWQEVVDTTPTTLAGARAKVDFYQWWSNETEVQDKNLARMVDRLIPRPL